MKAKNLSRAENPDQTQRDFVNILISRAEGIYDLAERSDLWQTG
ncbi:DUF4826 family protein [Bowmanella sp. Y57]|uniref:DUF4826 family protein n=1 Tax=Bowmanella yangjiangensis TaxID=2811230 RepID=A0ABS3CY89_9ALTE|nr:DUF4826 family protein [Bowmanella yangjiangensis]